MGLEGALCVVAGGVDWFRFSKRARRDETGLIDEASGPSLAGGPMFGGEIDFVKTKVQWRGREMLQMLFRRQHPFSLAWSNKSFPRV